MMGVDHLDIALVLSSDCDVNTSRWLFEHHL